MKRSSLLGFIIGSSMMTLAIGPLPYWSEHGFPVGWDYFGVFTAFIVPMIAGFVSAFITGGDKKNRFLSSVLPALPAVAVYGYLLDILHIGDGIPTSSMIYLVAGMAATGGAINILLHRSYG